MNTSHQLFALGRVLVTSVPWILFVVTVVAAQEKAAIGAEVVVHFESNFEVGEFLVGDDDAAVAGDVLAADEGAV